MSNAWQTTDEDIMNVMARHGVELDEEEIEFILSRLDHDAIERAALFGDEIEDQTGYAYDEIDKQIHDGNLRKLASESVFGG